MLYVLPSYYIITEGYIYISATPSNNTYKGLIMDILCYMFFYHITSLQKDLNLPPPPNNTYKGCLMVVILMLFHHINYIITEGSKSATPSKQYV